MTTPISNTMPSVDASQLASTAQKNDGMIRDAFLKLLVAQLANQDPLKPMEGT